MAIRATGLVIRDLPLLASNYRNEQSLQDYLKSRNIVAIADIDTRRLTRILREKGAQNGCLVAGDDVNEALALEQARGFVGLKGMDLAKEVTVAKSFEWSQGSWSLAEDYNELAEADFHVVAFDFGTKRNILRMLVDRGCRLTVVPAQTSAEEVLAMSPDGVFLSNGPGDPDPCDYAIKAIADILKTNTPVFGICLGLQLLALASGAKTRKMGRGHHGANHPVKNLDDGTVLITRQNHGFCVDEDSLPDDISVTHRSLFDGTLQGLHLRSRPAFGFQGDPEASLGPHDASPLFDHYLDLMRASNSDTKT